MQTSLVLTVLGPDRPGLVQALSDVLNSQQGNWSESRMVHLAGQFAGLLQISLPEANVETFKAELVALQAKGLQVLIGQAGAADELATRTLRLELLGQDRPGIIRDITRQLAALNVNIEELSSEQRVAPMSGETLFFAELTLGLPGELPASAVQDALEELSDQLMVDLQFGD